MREAFYPKLRLHPDRDARLIRWWQSLPPSERASEWRRVLHWALDLIESGWVPGVVVPFEAVGQGANRASSAGSPAAATQAPPADPAPRGDAEPGTAGGNGPDTASSATEADPRWAGLLAEFE